MPEWDVSRGTMGDVMGMAIGGSFRDRALLLSSTYDCAAIHGERFPATALFAAFDEVASGSSWRKVVVSDGSERGYCSINGVVGILNSVTADTQWHAASHTLMKHVRDIGQSLRGWEFFDDLPDATKALVHASRRRAMSGSFERVSDRIREFVRECIRWLTGKRYKLTNNERQTLLGCVVEFERRCGEADAQTQREELLKSFQDQFPAKSRLSREGYRFLQDAKARFRRDLLDSYSVTKKKSVEHNHLVPFPESSLHSGAATPVDSPITPEAHSGLEEATEPKPNEGTEEALPAQQREAPQGEEPSHVRYVDPFKYEESSSDEESDAEKDAKSWPLDRFPTVAEVVDTLRQRPIVTQEFATAACEDLLLAVGYAATAEQQHQDKKLLLRLLTEYNKNFLSLISRTQEEDMGVIERLDLKVGDDVYARADLHSDLLTLIVQLDMHQTAGDLDGNYRCRSGFHLLIAGDLIDRGINDIQVLLVIVALFLANPDSVHIIRGNHEATESQRFYSAEGQWIGEHEDLLEPFYRSLPLAICCGVRGEEYVHFSHGSFSTSVQPQLLIHNPGESYLVVPADLDPPSPPACPDSTLMDKQQRAQARLAEQELALASRSLQYVWGDVRENPGEIRNRAFALSPEDFHCYARATGCVKAFVRGHEHIAKEWTVPRKQGGEKVLITTLPVGTLGGAYYIGGIVPQQAYQGQMYHVAAKVKDWQKQWAKIEEQEGSICLALQEQRYGMYEPSLPS